MKCIKMILPRLLSGILREIYSNNKVMFMALSLNMCIVQPFVGSALMATHTVNQIKMQNFCDFGVVHDVLRPQMVSIAKNAVFSLLFYATDVVRALLLEIPLLLLLKMHSQAHNIFINSLHIETLTLEREKRTTR